MFLTRKLRENLIMSSRTRTICDNLPGGIHNGVKNLFSSKSLRKGGLSELAFHPEIDVYDSAGHTGCHVGSNQEFMWIVHRLHFQVQVVLQLVVGKKCLVMHIHQGLPVWIICSR